MLINVVVFYFSPATLITLTYCRPDETLCSWQEINKIQSVVGSVWKFCMLINLFSFINISTCEKLENDQLQDSCSKLAAYIQARIEYKLSTLCHTFFSDTALFFICLIFVCTQGSSARTQKHRLGPKHLIIIVLPMLLLLAGIPSLVQMNTFGLKLL